MLQITTDHSQAQQSFAFGIFLSQTNENQFLETEIYNINNTVNNFSWHLLLHIRIRLFILLCGFCHLFWNIKYPIFYYLIVLQEK